jgi:hypothetical protein
MVLAQRDFSLGLSAQARVGRMVDGSLDDRCVDAHPPAVGDAFLLRDLDHGSQESAQDGPVEEDAISAHRGRIGDLLGVDA